MDAGKRTSNRAQEIEVQGDLGATDVCYPRLRPCSDSVEDSHSYSGRYGLQRWAMGEEIDDYLVLPNQAIDTCDKLSSRPPFKVARQVSRTAHQVRELMEQIPWHVYYSTPSGEKVYEIPRW